MTDESGRGHVVEWLDRWRTNELDPPRARAVERHLESCAACREALADLEAFASAVERGYRASEAGRPEPDWGARRATIVERTAGRERSRRSRLVRWAPQVAIVAIAAVAIGVLWERGVRGPDDVERALRRSSAERAASAVGADDRRGEADEAVDTTLESRPEPEEEPPAGAPRREAPAERDEVGREEGAGERLRTPEPEAAARQEADAAPAPLPAAERFRLDARAALASRDTVLAREALGLWADSVAPAPLPAAERRRYDALADSLAALLSSRP